MYDSTNEIFSKSQLQEERARVDKAIWRIALELQKKDVPLWTGHEYAVPGEVARRSSSILTGEQAVMAGRILKRREPRKQAEQAESVAPDTAIAAIASEKKAKAKAPASPKANKSRKQKAPPRLRAPGGVFDDNQLAAADEKLAELLAKKKGIQLLQIVQEPMPKWAPSVE
jgi:hypothetical protein